MKQLYLTLNCIFFLLLPLHANASLPPNAAIASAHPLATDAGLEVLRAGGNAFDAAIAVTAALAVVEPTGSGLGGGGFWLLHREKDGYQTMLDGREKAPLAASKNMYLDKDGQLIPGLSMDGPLAAGIPGTVAAMTHLAKQYGRLSLQKTLAPAIRYAKNGFKVDSLYQQMAKFRLKALQASPAAAKVFLENNQVPNTGHLIIQTDLANTLSHIAQQGRKGFYQGETAEKLVQGNRAAGGIWTMKDLSQYQVEERPTIEVKYQGMTLTTVAPPSSGGVAMATILNILSDYPLKKYSRVQRIHYEVEAMRRAYRDRAEFLGDSDYYPVPVKQLTSARHAAALSKSINPHRATPSSDLPGLSSAAKGEDTTHFSILDKEGNRVAATLSINYPFGAAFVPPGTGVLLNDEMDDFSAKPGSPNAYGLVGGTANSIAPGKRPLSSMSPAFVENEQGIAILGTPGGSRIITMVLRAALAYNEGATAEEMVELPRIHHQYLPDVIQYEPSALSTLEVERLEKMGHKLKIVDWGFGNMQAVVWDKKHGKVHAASDPRGIGSAALQ